MRLLETPVRLLRCYCATWDSDQVYEPLGSFNDPGVGKGGVFWSCKSRHFPPTSLPRIALSCPSRRNIEPPIIEPQPGHSGLGSGERSWICFLLPWGLGSRNHCWACEHLGEGGRDESRSNDTLRDGRDKFILKKGTGW
jgi:hypothetical protein